ncbi:MAG: 4Fe-4S dicluster domain-containing protein [Planctomycetes bacterium]|jgi:Fe-S-cluster-containing hydrogenase component 2|nr:4Fe-4S dicluster domain-containing protein [Planctomycetota bacterium]
MKFRLHVTPERCIGCRTCELACAFAHPPQGGGIGRPRVAVHDLGEKVFAPVLCLQCEEAACVKACPVKALSRNEETGAVDVDEARCVHCLSCVAACPFGNLYARPDRAGVVKCDLCKGQPKCAMFCPSKALEYLPIRVRGGMAVAGPAAAAPFVGTYNAPANRP